MARMMVNHFVDKTQFSLIGSADNVNDKASRAVAVVALAQK